MKKIRQKKKIEESKQIIELCIFFPLFLYILAQLKLSRDEYSFRKSR